MPDNNGWSEWSRHVLAELKNHSKRLDDLDNKMDNHITHIEHRLTKMESNSKNVKWILGLIFTLLVGIFGIVLANYIG